MECGQIEVRITGWDDGSTLVALLPVSVMDKDTIKVHIMEDLTKALQVKMGKQSWQS